MKTKLFTVLMISLAVVMSLASCELLEDDTQDLGGDPSTMGEVNNNFAVTSISGVSDASAKVTERNGDVSKITYSATITDSKLLALIQAMPDVLVNGDKVSVTRDYRITTKGFQSVYPEGKLNIMKYDAKVGEKYTLEHNGNTIEREVTKVSKEDDYAWGFMLIKTTHVEETGRNIPGVSKIEFIGNHRWGMVGVVIYFEDGSSQQIGIFSDASNE
jgi:hypothetical protein